MTGYDCSSENHFSLSFIISKYEILLIGDSVPQAASNAIIVGDALFPKNIVVVKILSIE
jgi:hypothetical protein